MKPQRIQRKRTKGWKMPENTVYVGRPSEYGNPYYKGLYKDFTNADSVNAFKSWLDIHPEYVVKAKKNLKGKNLACWCKLGEPCHADVLLEIANS